MIDDQDIRIFLSFWKHWLASGPLIDDNDELSAVRSDGVPFGLLVHVRALRHDVDVDCVGRVAKEEKRSVDDGAAAKAVRVLVGYDEGLGAA